MQRVDVEDVLKVSKISVGNDAAWEELMEISKWAEEDIMFNFGYIDLDEPWRNSSFKKFIANEFVHISLYMQEDIVNNIEIMLKLDGKKANRVENREAQEVIEPVKIELRVLDDVDQLLKNVDIDGNHAVIDIPNFRCQLYEEKTLRVIEGTILRLKDDFETESVSIEAKNIEIKESLIPQITDLISRMKEDEGIDVTFNSESEKIMSTMTIYENIDITKKYKTIEKSRILSDNIPIGTVGLISRFKETRATDVFGRCGGGIPIRTRVAIFKGIKTEGKKFKAVFDTFNGHMLRTKFDYACDTGGNDSDDDDYCTELVPDHEEVDISKMGLCNFYLGSLYYFRLPIQYSKEDYIASYERNSETGSVEVKPKNLPEYIKMVFEDYGIDYNKEKLEEALQETIEALENERS